LPWRFWLAVDDEGEVLDLLVQRRRDKADYCGEADAQLLKKHGFAPDVLVTDKLRSYAAAKSELRLKIAWVSSALPFGLCRRL
jgi:transposase-like protein